MASQEGLPSARPPEERPAEQPPRPPGIARTEAFSDGVFAIVITVLVLDLVNPRYRPGGLGAALADQWPAYLAFGLSFVYVGSSGSTTTRCSGG
jgi:uncharacterized membrane protein